MSATFEARRSPHFLFIIAGLGAVSSPTIGRVLVLIGFAVFGLQHGAFDLEYLKRSHRSVAGYVSLYVAIAMCFYIIAQYRTNVALAIFLIASAAHFGIDHYRRINAETRFAILSPTLWALALLQVIFASHRFEILTYVSYTEFGGLESAIVNLLLSRWLLCLSAIFAVFAGGKKRPAETAGLIGLLIVLPIEVGAGLFFVYWHASNSYDGHRSCLELSLRDVVTATAPLTIGAVIIGALSYYVLSPTREFDPRWISFIASFAFAHVCLHDWITRGFDSPRLPSELLLSSEALN